MPLLMLPMAMSSFAQALISIRRASKFLASEEIPQCHITDPTSPNAVDIDGDFTWEPARNHKSDEDKEKEEKEKKAKEKEAAKAAAKAKPSRWSWKKGAKEELPTTAETEKAESDKPEEPQEPPFELKDLKFSAPKGSFVGIIGRIGSGKVSVCDFFFSWPFSIPLYCRVLFFNL